MQDDTMRNHTSLFPQLELLESLSTEDFRKHELSNILLVGVQHLNETTGSVIEKIVSQGFKPENILLLGKSYSTNFKSLEKLKILGCSASSTEYSREPGKFNILNQEHIHLLWDLALETILKNEIHKVLILDDGGRLISSIPDSLKKMDLICIEQTTKGIRNKLVYQSKFPVISVAESFTKINFESNVIAAAVIQKLEHLLSTKLSIGIIGLGNIGRALHRNLKYLGYNVRVSDLKIESESIEQIIRNNDLVLGCTGSPLELSEEWFLNKKTILASCSSEDIEFQDFFKYNVSYNCINRVSSAPDFLFKSLNSEILILNSGFPINFDNNKEIENQCDIQMTRGLIYSAIQQAISDDSLKSGLNKLSFKYEEQIQHFIKNHEVNPSAQAI